MSERMNKGIPLVSIICPAYNHQSYIAKALDGFVMQKTNFEFEIIIHDDASTDNTVQIIKQYEARYPHLFVNIYQTENQFSKSIHNISKICFAKARGKYIALCEGDDYWSDQYKLQKQVDFLENNPAYSICFTRGLVRNSFLNTESVNSDIESGVELNVGDFIKENSQLTATTVFARNSNFKWPEWLNDSPFGDWGLYLLLMHGSAKKAWCLPDITTVYLIHASGMHGNLHESNLKLINAYKMHLLFYNLIKANLFLKNYRIEISNAISERITILTRLYIAEKSVAKGIYLNCSYLFKGLKLRTFVSNFKLIAKK